MRGEKKKITFFSDFILSQETALIVMVDNHPHVLLGGSISYNSNYFAVTNESYL